jgi:hypothetical protein
LSGPEVEGSSSPHLHGFVDEIFVDFGLELQKSAEGITHERSEDGSKDAIDHLVLKQQLKFGMRIFFAYFPNILLMEGDGVSYLSKHSLYICTSYKLYLYSELEASIR